MIRVRIVYSKGESLKYTGHLDLHRVWERSIRRAKLPLAYSQGFHPQPKIQQACPLPLGFTSVAEMIDIWLTEDLHVESVKNHLLPAIPNGIDITQITLVPLTEPPLQTQVSASDFLAIVDPEKTSINIDVKIQNILSLSVILRERRGKPYDLRKLILQLKTSHSPELGIFMRLSALPGATGRPEEVLDCLEIDPNSVNVMRTSLIFADQI